MKIKVNPEDFRVEEILSAPLSQDESPHRVYRLRKRNWNTVDALAEIARAGEIPLKELRWCGRKDRAALTTQYFSTTSRKDLAFKSTNVSAEYTGFSDSPLGPSSISGNRFNIIIREMTEEELATASERLKALKKSGFANYFDDQRFGDAGNGGFLGEMLVKRRFDAAVKKLLTSCHPEAPSSTRKRKSAISGLWGQWVKVASLCTEPDLKPMVEALQAGEGSIGALRKVPREEMGQYLSSYQSFIWNMVLKGFLEQRGLKLFEIPCLAGKLLQYKDLSQEELASLSSLQIPTAGGEMLPLAKDIKQIMSRVLFERGVKLAKFRLPEIPQAYFASFLRPAIIIPGELKWEAAPDSLFPSRQMLRLEFFLPRGSFATMLIKSIGGETE